MNGDTEATIRGWGRDFSAASNAGDGPLVAHSAQCLGCGPDNPHGHHLEVYREGDRVLARHTFDARHVGAPGVAHGGAVAAVLDDLGGFVLYVVGELGVTRNLNVDYYAPVRLHLPYRLSGWLDRREGRKLFLRMEGRDPAGQLAFSADALFLVVSTDHFLEANAGDPVASEQRRSEDGPVEVDVAAHPRAPAWARSPEGRGGKSRRRSHSET